jgi:hypothetical protein
MRECEEQLRHLCSWNRRLARENTLLQLKVRGLEQKVAGLEGQAASLSVERDAIDAALGAAMDAALEGKR